MLRVGIASSILAVSAGLFGSAPAAACSCGKVSDEEAFGYADAVFVGTAGPSYLGESAGHVYTVTVEAVYKGSVRSTQQIVTIGCAGGPESHERSVIFAHEPRNPKTRASGALEVGCLAPRSTELGPIPASFGKPTEPPQVPSRLIPIYDRDRPDEIRWPLSLTSILAAVVAGGATLTYAVRQRRSGA